MFNEGHVGDLINKQYPPIRYVVDGLLSTGLCIFAGRAKEGKSWIAMELAYACSIPTVDERLIFGEYRADTMGAVYFDFEMTEPRSMNRVHILRQRFQAKGFDEIPGLTFVWECGVFDQDGLKAFERYIVGAKLRGQRLFVIDTMTYIIPSSLRGTNAYHSESEWLRQIKKIADRQDVCVMLITHTSKAMRDDPFDTVSGSLAMTGIPDTVWVLDRVVEDGEPTMKVKIHIKGKDVRRRTITLQSGRESWDWKVIEDDTRRHLR